MPHELCDHHIRIAERAFAKEMNRCPWITHERPKNPSHLNPNERVKHDPQSQHESMTRIALNERTIQPPQDRLPRETRDCKHARVEQQGGLVLRRRAIPDG